jgi:MEMO1 family protein
MATATSRPRLRPIDTIAVSDPQRGRMLVLRDSQGIAQGHVAMPVALSAIVGRFTGRHTCAQIARAVSDATGEEIPVEAVVTIASQLEDALYCEGPRYAAALARAHAEFAGADVRHASHAGGAYYEAPKELVAYLDGKCLGVAKKHAHGKAHAPHGHSNGHGARIVGLIAPHIDPWRGAVGYGHAYGALREALAPEADTFVLFGTSHAPMREPFALCKKAFHTPLGPLAADTDAIDRLAAAASFDPYADQYNHKREHSLEFQVVFLKHLLGKRPARIVPILAGLGEHQAHGKDPANDVAVERFVEAVRALVASRPGRVVLIAGADLAHVGPRFGDPRGFDTKERSALEGADRASLAHASGLDAPAFWKHVSSDLDTRRVCGLAPIYSLLRALPRGARGKTLHYEQTVDAEDGSIVSHAAVGYFG